VEKKLNKDTEHNMALHVGEVGKDSYYVSTGTFSLHMILIKGRKGKYERKACAGGRPGVERLRKLSRNSNNAGG